MMASPSPDDLLDWVEPDTVMKKPVAKKARREETFYRGEETTALSAAMAKARLKWLDVMLDYEFGQEMDT